MGLSSREKLAAAVLRVCEPPKGMAPYFGVMLRGLVRREVDGLGTIGVTKDGVMLWDAAFVEKVDVGELAVVLMHEVMHVVLKHHERAEQMGIVPDPSPEAHTKAAMANCAMDMCINEELEKISKIPAGGVTPATFGQPLGLTFEERYRLLQQEVKKQRQPKPGEDQQQDNGVDEAQDGEKQKPGAGKGWCGSAAGRPVPQEPASKGQRDGEGRSEAEMERFRKATAEAVKEHEAKGRGNVPGSLSRWADTVLQPPKIHWREKLARIVRGAVAYRSGCSDYTWGKISRRQAGVGFGVGRPVIPALHSPVPRVMVAVDSSGSVSAEELAAAMAETAGILAAVGAAVDYCVCDAAVHTMKSVRTVQEAMAGVIGGGGTDFRPVFDELEKRKPRIDTLIFFTDGCGPAPVEPPAHTSVIWVLIGQHAQEPCTWGEMIRVSDER